MHVFPRACNIMITNAQVSNNHILTRNKKVAVLTSHVTICLPVLFNLLCNLRTVATLARRRQYDDDVTQMSWRKECIDFVTLRSLARRLNYSTNQVTLCESRDTIPLQIVLECVLRLSVCFGGCLLLTCCLKGSSCLLLSSSGPLIWPNQREREISAKALSQSRTVH